MQKLDRFLPLHIVVVFLWLGTLPSCGLGLLLVMMLGRSQGGNGEGWQIGLLLLLAAFPFLFLVSGQITYARVGLARPKAIALMFHTAVLIIGSIIAVTALSASLPAMQRVAADGPLWSIFVPSIGAAVACLAYLRILIARITQAGDIDHALS